MKERPILFNGAMVRAILDGRKTVTRRVMKSQPDDDATITVENYHPAVTNRRGEQEPGPEIFGGHWRDGECGCKCPYGQPGDRLWVREAFAYGLCTPSTMAYRATNNPSDLDEGWDDPIKWTPSIHMPRAACRILLEITAVRVERLQDISEEQAEAEGVHRDVRMWFATDEGGPAFTWPQHAFAHLWRGINGAESWDANPWVWVVEFKRVTP